jgi:hypothetical protein
MVIAMAVWPQHRKDGVDNDLARLRIELVAKEMALMEMSAYPYANRFIQISVVVSKILKGDFLINKKRGRRAYTGGLKKTITPWRNFFRI